MGGHHYDVLEYVQDSQPGAVAGAGLVPFLLLLFSSGSLEAPGGYYSSDGLGADHPAGVWETLPTLMLRLSILNQRAAGPTNIAMT